MRLWDDKGREITLGRQIGRAGGEGKVHEIRGQSAFVAKIYHSPADGQKAEKLIQMTRMTSEKLLKTCAWPVRLILDERKKTICGVTMPIVRGKEVHKLYSPRDRYREFPKYTWKELVWVARNITSAFDIIHTQGIVMGDVNEGNVLVNDNGTVTLIDCDSYQISTNGKSYVCDVGIGLWTPPELQNANLSRVARTENHDLFGLAQLVFLLLFMGRHPFAGIPINNEDYEIEEAIRRYLFAYGSNQSQVRPPDIALRLDHLPTNCQSLFLRAFSRGSEKPRNRPPAKEWSECLGYLTKNLRACSYDSGHSYPVHLHSCPWCELFRKHGINFFWTAVTIIQTQGETANLLQFVQAISRLEPIPQNSRAPSSYTAPTLTGTPFGGSRTNPTFIWGFVVIAASALLVSAGLLFAVLGIFVAISGFLKAKKLRDSHGY